MQKKKLKLSPISIIKFSITALVLVLSIISLFFSASIESFLNLNKLDYKGSVLSGGLKVNYIDVGQGDSTLIETETNERILIDTGSSNEENKLSNFMEKQLIEKQIFKIDVLILTHADSDHIGNSIWVMEHFDIDLIYLPQVSYADNKGNQSNLIDDSLNQFEATTSTLVYKNLLVYISQNNLTWTNYFQFENLKETVEDKTQNSLDTKAEFTFLNEHPTAANTEDNNFSPFFLMQYNTMKFLFSGDANDKAEKALIADLETKGSLDFLRNITILKAGHHGSKSSTSREYLDATTPQVVTISSGKDNSYGHPAPELLKRLFDTPSIKQICRTDQSGSILITTTPTNQAPQIAIAYINLQPLTFISWWMLAVTVNLVLNAALYCNDINRYIKVKKQIKTAKEKKKL